MHRSASVPLIEDQQTRVEGGKDVGSLAQTGEQRASQGQLSHQLLTKISADLPPAEEVIANRCGDVLIKHTTLKADHFPSCHNTKLTPVLEGAPNFRQASIARTRYLAAPDTLRKTTCPSGARTARVWRCHPHSHWPALCPQGTGS
jgi:hypothetical protein